MSNSKKAVNTITISHNFNFIIALRITIPARVLIVIPNLISPYNKNPCPINKHKLAKYLYTFKYLLSEFN